LGLRRRIFLNHLATLAIATTGTLLGLAAGNLLWRSSHERVQLIEQEVQVIDNLNIRILQALPPRNHYLATEKITHIDEHLENDSQVMKQFIMQLERLRPDQRQSALAPELKLLLDDLIRHSRGVLATLNQTKVRLATVGEDPVLQRQTITEMMHAEAITTLQASTHQLDQLRNRLAADLGAGRAKEERAEALEVLIPIVSALVAASLGLLFAWRTSGAILRPIDRLNRRIAELRSSGNLNLQPLQQGSVPREIRDLTENFNGLILRLREVLGQLETLSLTDPLTQVGNRRCFDQVLTTEVSRHRRDGQSLALLLLDLDHFKAYNDGYGHPAGDQCLIMVADLLKELFRRSADRICRIGGEEFAVILPRTADAEAQRLAARIVEATASLDLEHRHNPPFGRVTVSVGVSSGRPSESLTCSWLLQAADQALYRCKGELGRNVVACAPPHDPIQPALTTFTGLDSPLEPCSESQPVTNG